jgi:hypothetical protein
VTARIVSKLTNRGEGPKPHVLLGDLFGPAGNATAILSACRARLAIQSFPPAEIAAFTKYAKRADYPTLLRAVLECFAMSAFTERQIRKLLKHYGPAAT